MAHEVNEADSASTLNTGTFLDKLQWRCNYIVKASVRGLAVLGTEIFVVHDRSSQVDAYYTNNFTLSRDITIHGSQNHFAILASARHNCLYINDVGQRVIYRYYLENKIITQWSVGGDCYGFSLTAANNLLVTMYNDKQIKEFTPDGQLIREISLDISIQSPWHSVQYSDDLIVVSDNGGPRNEIHQVCMIDMNGRIIRSYGGRRGSGVGQLNNPHAIQVDTHGHVLIADTHNYRVVLLNDTLTHLGYIAYLEFEFTFTMHLDELNKRLYIAGSSGLIYEFGVDNPIMY